MNGGVPIRRDALLSPAVGTCPPPEGANRTQTMQPNAARSRLMAPSAGRREFYRQVNTKKFDKNNPDCEVRLAIREDGYVTGPLNPSEYPTCSRPRDRLCAPPACPCRLSELECCRLSRCGPLSEP